MGRLAELALVAETRELGNTPPGWVEEDWRSLLGPPEEPGSLGRLGRFAVLDVLGAGGMGVVFLAEDRRLRRKVAVKAMRPALAASAGARQRFLREAQLAAGLQHDHIVPVYQLGEDGGVLYLAMPLLRGETLEARLRRDDAPSVAEILQVGRETAEGLAAAHEAGLIHRDIKPSNLWLERKDEGGRMKDEPAPGRGSACPPSSFRVKILDFGLARPAEDDAQVTTSGDLIGTPAYMAPEQAGHEPVDARRPVQPRLRALPHVYRAGALSARQPAGDPPRPGERAAAARRRMQPCDSRRRLRPGGAAPGQGPGAAAAVGAGGRAGHPGPRAGGRSPRRGT
jgi:serine/threonine protein kinase